MQLYFTDLGALSRPLSIDDLVLNPVPGVLDLTERAGLIEDMPFILMDDGSYDLDLNRFFRACPSMGARSLNTWRSYARTSSSGPAFSMKGAGASRSGRPTAAT